MQHICLYFLIIFRNLDSSVSIVTRLWAGKLRKCGSVFSRVKRCVSFPLICIGSGAHPATYLVGDGDIFAGVKWLGHEVKHSLPFSAKIKNEWHFTSTSYVSLWHV
jgi:hypothetical protein